MRQKTHCLFNLPNNANDLLTFIKNERARELFQEGFRLYDLRRWDETASVYANAAPNISFTYNNYKISDFVFPIPSSEINAGLMQVLESNKMIGQELFQNKKFDT